MQLDSRKHVSGKPGAIQWASIPLDQHNVSVQREQLQSQPQFTNFLDILTTGQVSFALTFQVFSSVFLED